MGVAGPFMNNGVSGPIWQKKVFWKRYISRCSVTDNTLHKLFKEAAAVDGKFAYLKM
jgi:hypothetical protein